MNAHWWSDLAPPGSGAIVCNRCGSLVFVLVRSIDVHEAVCPGRNHRWDVENYVHFDCCGKGMVPREQ